MSYFMILRGPAGVGKTTIARKLAQLLSACYVSIDSALAEHGLEYVPGDLCVPEHRMLAVNKIIIPLAQSRLIRGQIVIFDGNFYHKSQIEDLIAQLKHAHIVYTLQASLAECLARNKQRESCLDDQAVTDVFVLVAELCYGVVIDTSGKTIDDVLEELHAKCLR
jgi:predicted kinase